jgi:perosamine synthetase
MTSKFYPLARPSISDKEEGYVMSALKSGWISSLGPYVDEFEKRFSAFCNARYGIAVSNGTVGLHLTLRALGIKDGDEVIVPDLSFIATANAIVMAGATPVFCDIDREILCIDPALIRGKITNRTKAIIAVHLYGHPADMDAINVIAAEHGLTVIEDGAEAHGAEVRGKRVGGLGNCAVFSFYANKNLTTGEGGMITTNDLEFAERCRYLRDHAMSKSRRYWHEELGYNYRLTNIQAAIGCAQVERAEHLLRAKREIFQWYQSNLEGTAQIRLNRTASWAANGYWLVCLELCNRGSLGRDHFIEALRTKGVDSRPYFYPMSDMPYFETADTPVAHEVTKIGINLPTFVGLTRDDVNYICSAIKMFLAEV